MFQLQEDPGGGEEVVSVGSVSVDRSAPGVAPGWGMSVCHTISAIMEQSSLTEQDLSISGMDLVVSHQKTANALASLMFAAKILTSSLHLLPRSSMHQSVEEGTRMVLE